jgi:hypothetical protein
MEGPKVAADDLQRLPPVTRRALPAWMKKALRAGKRLGGG